MSKASLFLLLFISNYALYSQEKLKTLGILNLESSNISEVSRANMRTLTNRLHTELSKMGRFQIVEMQKVEEILNEQGLQQTGVCETDQCVAELGHLLGVEWMLTGSIGYIGTTYSIDVRIIEVQTRKIVETAFENYRGKSEGLLDVMRAIATKLSYPADSQSPAGGIRIASQPSGARVMLNTTEAGITPLTINDLLPGDYRIQCKMDGYLHRPVTIKVKSSRIEQVDLKLMKLYSLKIETNPAGARVLLNGKEMGMTPFTGPIVVGTYQTQILLDGYVPWKELMIVSADYEKKIQLTKMGLYISKTSAKNGKKKWPWIVAGFCIAGGGAAATVLLKADKEESGTLSVVAPQTP